VAQRHPSAIKRHRQSLKRHDRNRAVKTRVRSDIRKLREALGRQDAGAARSALQTSVKGLSKAASKGILHRNTARRRVARLSKQVAALEKAG